MEKTQEKNISGNESQLSSPSQLIILLTLAQWYLSSVLVPQTEMSHGANKNNTGKKTDSSHFMDSFRMYKLKKYRGPSSIT